MTTLEVAHAVVALNREGKFAEAQDRFWSDGVVAVEAMGGPMDRLEGRAAIQPKLDWWAANHEVHGVEVTGPFVGGDRFAMHLVLDVTPKDGARTRMSEVVLCDVRDGKIVEERYLYQM